MMPISLFALTNQLHVPFFVKTRINTGLQKLNGNRQVCNSEPTVFTFVSRQFVKPVLRSRYILYFMS